MPIKLTPQPSHRMFLARNSINSNTTCLQLLACKTSGRLFLVNTRVHRDHATSVHISKKHQLKLRESRNTCSRQYSSTWKLWKNPTPHSRHSRTVSIRHEHQLHCPLHIITTITHALLTLYGRDCTTTPPNNRQRNKVNPKKPRQQDNLRQQQKWPRSLQQDHTLRKSGGIGTRPLANETG